MPNGGKKEMPKRKNILFLLTDQHRWDSLGANAGLVRTPNLDAVAADGTRFTEAFTCNPLCSPARASILTGQYPHEHKVIVNIEDFNGLSPMLNPARPTFISRLKETGYNTAYIGKWHLGPADNKPTGLDKWLHLGLYYQMLKERGIDWDMWTEDKKTMTGPDATFFGKLPIPEELAPTAWVADRTINALDELAAGKAPFCIYASWYGPHFPTTIPEPFFSMYDPESIEKPANFNETFLNKPRIQQKERWRWNAEIMNWQKWQQVIARYYGFCTFIDFHIGRIIQHLRSIGEYDNTLILFTADHGGLLGDHGLFNKGFNFYEETMRIPFVARLPFGSRGNIDNHFISLVDICPTLLEYAGAPGIQPSHGRSLLPLLQGAIPKEWRDAAFAQFNGYETTLYSQRMLRTRKYKYCYNPADIDELYNLEKDPAELNNLVTEPKMNPMLNDLREKLYREMKQYSETCIDTCSYGIGVNRRISGKWEE
jgi:choline-sulfatase